jgi:hypothetical protein
MNDWPEMTGFFRLGDIATPKNRLGIVFWG